MAPKWLKTINILAIPVILAVLVFFWLYERDQYVWGVCLVILILLLVAYLNVRKPIIDYIETRTKMKNKPVDAKAEQRLTIINYMAFIAVLLIGVITTFLPREQFMWSVICMVLILILAGYLNIRKIISDISKPDG